MKCASCGCELPKGAGFCFQCGAKQTEVQAQEEGLPEYKFCPYCSVKNDEDAVFCSSCGKAMDMSKNTVEVSVQKKEDSSGKKFPKKLAIGAATFLLAVGGACVVGALLMGNHKYVAYLKDGSVNQADLEHDKKEAVKYSGDYGNEDSLFNAYVEVEYSRDGKYIFYPTEVRYDGGAHPEFRLNMQRVGKEEEPVKLGSSVWRYSVLAQNKAVYIKPGNNTLYINDKKNHKEKIASNVMDYYIDEDEKNIVWIETDGEAYAMYQQDLALKKEKKTLAEDINLYEVSENLEQIVVREADTLYIIRDFGEKEKIVSNVSRIIANSEETGSVYYSKIPEKEGIGTEIIEDDCAESDASIKEPEYNSFITQRVEKNEYTGKYERVEGLDQEAYDLAWEKYEAKKRREEIRQGINMSELGTYVNELYCFRDGKEELIDEAYVDLLYDYGTEGKKKGVFAFGHYKMEEVPKIKMSEIDSFSDLSELYYENLRAARETCIYTGEKVIVLAEDFPYAVALDTEQKIGYGLKGEAGAYTLMSFSIGESSDGTCKTVAENVDSIQMLTPGKIYYLTDVYESAGELYCNEEYINSDVFVGSLTKVNDAVAYAVDYDSNKCQATLKLYDGKENRKIADDVHAYYAFDEKDIVVLADYNMDRQEGKLKYYSGRNELVDIDEDVTAIFGGTVLYY